MKDRLTALVESVKSILSHIWQVLGFLVSPGKLATYMEQQHTAGVQQGNATGYVNGRTATLTEIARMPRKQRRLLISGAVKTFGRKPARTGQWPADWPAYKRGL